LNTHNSDKKAKQSVRQQKLFSEGSAEQHAPEEKKSNLIEEFKPIKAPRRKFQVSNGYLLEFDQLARILHVLLDYQESKKVSKETLEEETGFVDRQVETLVSMGAAMGLIIPNRQILSPIGLIIAKHDIFIEKKGSLEWCHYNGAGSVRRQTNSVHLI